MVLLTTRLAMGAPPLRVSPFESTVRGHGSASDSLVTASEGPGMLGEAVRERHRRALQTNGPRGAEASQSIPGRSEAVTTPRDVAPTPIHRKFG